MINRELYEKDPRTNKLLNNGVAKVTSGQSSPELETLRYEITNFVCGGQYTDGLNRILSTYLGNLDKSEQPGVWVSGFYGSGKSHLVKVLQHLWIDFEFLDDKATARGLAKLPTAIQDLLKELSTAAKRLGGVHAAAGTLGAGAGDSVRLELLGIVFKSVGLPEHCSRASFVMWLRHEVLEEAVRKHIAKAGRDFDVELDNLYVSDAMANAILAARPEFASKSADVKVLLEKQFPEKNEISIKEMIEKIKAALSKKGKFPCTLIVLDEVQQYIGDSVERSKAVQDVQEQCCAQLGANVMFVATGQNALSGTPLLQRLQGRFPVSIELQDTDVEQVTREVVLKKKPSKTAELKKFLDDNSGEIERQLANTKIAFTTRDRQLLVQDYPILPVRRRFWEKVLRAVDTAGTGAQLRTQLAIIYDAVLRTADLPLGNVVSGAFLFEHILSKALQSGVLLQEISATIARQKNEDDGDLRYQLCALIFLIGQLPHQSPADVGIRANAETLADLIVTDLTKSSAELRKKVPELLEKLVASGAVMQVDDEYRMQTREGAEWNQIFVEARNKLLGDAGKLASERSQLLKAHCSEMLKKSKLLHGVSKEPRKFELHFGADAPPTDGASVPVWVRDGWEVQESTVVDDARKVGDNMAMVFGFAKKNRDQEIRQAIAAYYAATTTLQNRGTPASKEGIEARKAMETRQEQAQRARDTIINEILDESIVYIAGGDPVYGMLLESKVQDASRACLDRLYPLFHLADSADWHKVIDRSRNGDGDALAAVGHKGDPEAHAVCKAILEFVGSGKKGNEIRKHFGAPPYGWPQDAIDAALMVLFGGGQLRAVAGHEPITKGKLDQRNIATADFRCETIKLSNVQLSELRGLFKKAGLKTNPHEELLHAPEFISRLKKLSESAGGEPPLPKCPDISHLVDIGNRAGNEQLKLLHDNKDRLLKEIADWQKHAELIAKRLPHWSRLTALLNFAGDLAVAAEVRPEVKAIEDHRGLLADPDPVPGIVEKLATAFRKELNTVSSACQAEYDAGHELLDDAPNWKELTPEQRHDLLGANGIRVLPKIAVGSPDEILETLRHSKLSEWKALRDALPTRFDNALEAAAKLLEPEAQPVSLPSATLKSEQDLKEWLLAVEKRIREKLKKGPVIV